MTHYPQNLDCILLRGLWKAGGSILVDDLVEVLDIGHLYTRDQVEESLARLELAGRLHRSVNGQSVACQEAWA